MDRAHEPYRPLLRTKVGDRELEAGARAHYEDAAYYASNYAYRTEDIAYYRSIAQRHGEVVEHGIGSGRIAIPIARDGGRVSGIDHSRPMIADLRSRLRAEPAEVRARVTARVGDIRRAKFSKRVPLVICPFNTLLHLYTRRDVERWLANVRAQLAPRGELVFDVTLPVPEDLARSPDKRYRIPAFVHPTVGRVRYSEIFDYDGPRQILFVSMIFEPVRGEPFLTPLAHRQFYPQELEALLHYNGFEVTALYGDFQRGPLVRESDAMVWHTRPRSRGTR